MRSAIILPPGRFVVSGPITVVGDVVLVGGPR